MELQSLLELAVKAGPAVLVIILGFFIVKAFIEKGFELKVPGRKPDSK